MSTPLLVSHHLCPYVQRAIIVAEEKGIQLERTYIDLAAKPDWFTAISPTGKTPLLRVGEACLFESAVICEYLDETSPGSLMPPSPVDRARIRGWVEFGSGTLADIAGLYSAQSAEAYDVKRTVLEARFQTLDRVVVGPWFEGAFFSHADVAFGPVFRYLDAFERLADLELAKGLPNVAAWRRELAARPSVAAAVSGDYPERLAAFLAARRSHLSGLFALA